MKYLLLIAAICATCLTVHAQSKYCDKLIKLSNDTVVCQDFKKRKTKLFREIYYLHGEVLFTRWWHYKRNGEYYWHQQSGKSAFAKKNGPGYWFHPNGQVKWKVTFVADRKVGECLGFFPDGKPERLCHHNVLGNVDGIVTTFFANGQLATRARWANGRLVEILENKDEQGHDFPIGSFKDGYGEWRTPEYTYVFKNGKQVKKKRTR